MIKKDITFENLEGERVTKTFYFHVSKADLARLKMEYNGENDLESSIKHLLDTKDADGVIGLFERIILMSYGVRSADGESFIKTEERTAEFRHHPAFHELFYELATNAVAAAEFISGMLPTEISGKLQDTELMKMVQAGKPTIDAELPETPHPLTTETDNRSHPNPVFDLSPVPEPTPESSAQPITEPKPEEHVWTIKELAGLPDEEFKKLMQQYQGKTVPKILLQAAMQRF